MSGPRITDAAVEAGAEALAVANRGPWVSGQGIREGGIPWGTSHEAEVKPVYIHAATEALTAALPHIRRAVIEELAGKARARMKALQEHRIVDDTPEADEWETVARTWGWLRAELEGDGE